MKFEINMYWYARGYYAGRSEGVSELLDIDDEYRYAYKCGYDVGVSDYCDLDSSDTLIGSEVSHG